MKNILVWGSGFIASHLPYEQIRARATLDPAEIRAILTAYKTDVLINCIGYCGQKNIDDCLTNKEKTIMANTVLPTILATECDKLGIHMIHIGSGCIYAGKSPHEYCTECDVSYAEGCFHQGRDKRYAQAEGWIIDTGFKETDMANPVSFYSETKYACDLAINQLPATCVLRIRMPISSQNNPRNFISKIRGYKQLINIPNSITFTDDLVKCIQWCADNHKTGIYNVVNPEPLTAVQAMSQYQKHFPTHQFNIITEQQLNAITTSKRSNCILDGSKLKKEGFVMTPTPEALTKTMKEYVKNVQGDHR